MDGIKTSCLDTGQEITHHSDCDSGAVSIFTLDHGGFNIIKVDSLPSNHSIVAVDHTCDSSSSWWDEANMEFHCDVEGTGQEVEFLIQETPNCANAFVGGSVVPNPINPSQNATLSCTFDRPMDCIGPVSTPDPWQAVSYTGASGTGPYTYSYTVQAPATPGIYQAYCGISTAFGNCPEADNCLVGPYASLACTNTTLRDASNNDTTTIAPGQTVNMNITASGQATQFAGAFYNRDNVIGVPQAVKYPNATTDYWATRNVASTTNSTVRITYDQLAGNEGYVNHPDLNPSWSGAGSVPWRFQINGRSRASSDGWMPWAPQCVEYLRKPTANVLQRLLRRPDIRACVPRQIRSVEQVMFIELAEKGR